MDRPRSDFNGSAPTDAGNVPLPETSGLRADTGRCSKCGAPRLQNGACSEVTHKFPGRCPDPTFDYRQELLELQGERVCAGCGAPRLVDGRCALGCGVPNVATGRVSVNVSGIVVDALAGTANEAAQARRTLHSLGEVAAALSKDAGRGVTAELAAAAGELAARNVLAISPIYTHPGYAECEECQMAAEASRKILHAKSCVTGRVLGLADEAKALTDASPEPAERPVAVEFPRPDFAEPWDVQTRYAGETPLLVSTRDRVLLEGVGRPEEMRMLLRRVAACVNFLAGVPTEMLEAERPLADMARPVQEVIYLRRVFPGLPELAVTL